MREAEKKVLVIVTYFVLLATIAVAAITYYIVDKLPYVDAVTQYFSCESAQPGNCEKFKKEVDNYKMTSLIDTVFILIALYPLLQLLFVLDLKGAKYICSSPFSLQKKKKPYLTSQTSGLPLVTL